MMIDFVESHGLGNDYLVVDAARLGFELTPDRIRHTGVGSDGILALFSTRTRGGIVRVRLLLKDAIIEENDGNAGRAACATRNSFPRRRCPRSRRAGRRIEVSSSGCERGLG